MPSEQVMGGQVVQIGPIQGAPLSWASPVNGTPRSAVMTGRPTVRRPLRYVPKWSLRRWVAGVLGQVLACPLRG
jgi:hypothetical protein